MNVSSSKNLYPKWEISTRADTNLGTHCGHEPWHGSTFKLFYSKHRGPIYHFAVNLGFSGNQKTRISFETRGNPTNFVPGLK